MQTTVLEQWKLFLQRVGLKEEEMPADQQREMKRAFFGGVGQMLFYWRDDMQLEDEDAAVKHLEEMVKEISVFWEIELVTQNASDAGTTTLDKEGFFFVTQTAGIGWCRLNEVGQPMFLEYAHRSGWVVREFVGYEKVWKAAATKLPKKIEAALRKLPNT